MSNEVRKTISQTGSDADLQRSNIPDYSLVGFACAPSAAGAVTLTVGLVTGLPYPESRPIRVLMSREACRDLSVALERLARVSSAGPNCRSFQLG
jgi:hypothetical protein